MQDGIDGVPKWTRVTRAWRHEFRVIKLFCSQKSFIVQVCGFADKTEGFRWGFGFPLTFTTTTIALEGAKFGSEPGVRMWRGYKLWLHRGMFVENSRKGCVVAVDQLWQRWWRIDDQSWVCNIIAEAMNINWLDAPEGVTNSWFRRRRLKVKRWDDPEVIWWRNWWNVYGRQ